MFQKKQCIAEDLFSAATDKNAAGPFEYLRYKHLSHWLFQTMKISTETRYNGFVHDLAQYLHADVLRRHSQTLQTPLSEHYPIRLLEFWFPNPSGLNQLQKSESPGLVFS